jgi:hypothetical protein
MNLFKRKDRYKYKRYCKRKYKYRKEKNQDFFIPINFIAFSRYSSNVKVPHPHRQAKNEFFLHISRIYSFQNHRLLVRIMISICLFSRNILSQSKQLSYSSFHCNSIFRRNGDSRFFHFQRNGNDGKIGVSNFSTKPESINSSFFLTPILFVSFFFLLYSLLSLL